jgi:two-component sensor histidine kinase
MDYNLLLREVNHRCANDLQQVISLLRLASRRTESPETRESLIDAANRVHTLARARAALLSRDGRSLTAVMLDVVAALQIVAEPRSIAISLEAADAPERVSSGLSVALAMAVNELVTNSIKHAYPDGSGGRVRIAIARLPPVGLTLTVEDDGCPFDRREACAKPNALGLDLIRRLIGARGGSLELPEDGSKRFQIRVENVN